MKFKTFIPANIIETARCWKSITLEFLYRRKANRYGVQYIGLNKKHQLALFQDPVSGSSFGVRTGESVESGIKRVRERFGLEFVW